MMRVADRIELSPGIGDFQHENNVGLAHQGALVRAAAEIMGRGEIHATADIGDRCV